MSGNFDFKEQATRSTTRDDLQYDHDLSDNVVNDLIDYTRSVTVRNEEQFVLTVFGYISGFMESPKHFNSGVLIGTAGAGKSHLQNKVESLFPDDYLYYATGGTDKSIIYDDDLEEAYTASLDELQKPGDELIEVLKSLHGGEDEEFRYKVTGGGQGADRDTDEIVKEALPYWFLYAQYDPDFEMWDRLLKLPVHESKDKNEGVARSQWDHSMISFGDEDTEYVYDYEDGRKAIKDHLRSTPKDVWVKIPAGEDEFGWDAFEHAQHIFDMKRSETNRVANQVANLVRASALLNYKNRDVRKIEVRNEGVKETIIAEPQDLANVLACRQTLLSTTHQLDSRREAICVAIQKAGGTQQAASINKIQDYLRKTDMSFVKRTQIEKMLEELQDNYLVEKLRGAGENGRNLYEFQSWQSLGKFDISDEFLRVFEDTYDPFRDQPFVETAKDINKDLTPSAGDFMSEEVEVQSGSGSGQATLSGEPSVDVDLEPHEEMVRQRLKKTVDGEVIKNLDKHEPSIKELVGAVPLGEPSHEADLSDTIFDPNHEIWSYGPDDWVETTADAEQEVEKAIRNLTIEGVFQTSETKSRGGEPLEMKVSVKDV